MKIELINRKGIVVSALRWSDNRRYFEVTHEVKQPGSMWTDCRVLLRTAPIYNLTLLHKLLPGDKYREFIFWRAEQLYKKAERKLQKEDTL